MGDDRKTDFLPDAPGNIGPDPGENDSRFPARIGPYRILKALGRGGMGVVYLGRDDRVQTEVAVKTVLVPEADLCDSIRREAQTLRALSHPGIVPVLADGVQDGVPWYAMKLMRGTSLTRYVGSIARSRAQESSWDRTPFTVLSHPESECGLRKDEEPPAQGAGPAAAGDVLIGILTLTRRLCVPLAYLHGEGVVHRDLKPDNILVQRGGWPVIIDFGLAATFAAHIARERMEGRGEPVGTVAYLAPEQALGEPVDARADLYALGCILFELVTGRRPFEGATVTEVLRKKLQSTPPRVSELVANVPAALDDLLWRLLAKRPEDRIGFATDIAASLSVLGAGDAGTGTKPRTYLYRPAFVERREAIRKARRLLRQVNCEERGTILLVAGDAGVGKTRLAMYLASRAQEAGLTVATGKGEAGRQGSLPLYPLTGVVDAIAARCLKGGAAETVRLLGSRHAVLASCFPSLATLPGAPPEAPEPLSSSASVRRLFTFLAETLRRYTEKQAMLLVLDDLQWADRLTLEWLRFLVERKWIQRIPVALLCTYRETEASGMLSTLAKEGPNVHRLELPPMDRDGVQALAAGMLAMRELPSDLVDYLEQETGGNPFFVAEYLRTAVAEGLISRDDKGSWRGFAGADFRRLPEPRSIGEVLELRFTKLNTDGLAVLGTLAVLARPAKTPFLSQASGLRKEEVWKGINQLLGLHLVRVEQGDLVSFPNEGIRRAAFHRLDAPKRFHHRIAEALCATGRPEDKGDAGRHYEHAGLSEQARSCYLEAAHHAARTYLLDEAAQLYEHYLRLVASPTDESVDARIKLGAVLGQTGREREAIEVLEQAAAEARGLNQGLAAAALHKLADLHRRRHDYTEACTCVSEGLRLARATHSVLSEAMLLDTLASVRLAQHDYDASARLFHSALRLAQDSNLQDCQVYTLGNLGALRHTEGRFDEAKHLYLQAHRLMTRIGRTASTWKGNMGLLALEQGNYEEAEQCYREAIDIARKLKTTATEGLWLAQLSLTLAKAGRAAEAGRLAAKAAAIAESLGGRADIEEILWRVQAETPG